MLKYALNSMPEAIRRLTGLAAPGRRTSQAARPDCVSYGNPRPAPPRRMHPRRARCGLTLFEATLVMMIAVPVAQQGVRLAEHYIRAQAGVQESRLLSQVVSAASTLALRDLNDLITNRVGVGRIQVLTLDDLADQNAWLSIASRTALGRDVQVIFYARGSEELVVLARAVTPAGEDIPSYVPRGGDGIGLVGTVPENAPDMLRGPGLNYDLSALQAQARTQYGSSVARVGDQIAIAVLRMDQDVLPFLHRIAVDGLPELNRMQTDLDMGGFDLIGAGNLQADHIIVQNSIEISGLHGKLEVEGDIVAGGDLTIPGTLTSAQATIDGRINARGLEVIGQAQLGSVEALSVQVTGTARVTGDVTVDGAVETTTLAADNVVVGGVLAAQSATITTVQAGQVRSTLITSEQLVAEEIITGSCTGC